MKLDKDAIRIGSDFEVFLCDKAGNLVSAIPYNKGTKENPEPLERKGCAIQRDGILQEFNIPPVKLNESQLFWDNICYVKDHVKNKVAPLDIKCCSSGVLNEKEFDSSEAIELGCSASFNGWLFAEQNPRPEPKDPYFRSAGFHIHMSYNDASFDTTLDLVRLFDLFVTLPFVLIDGDTKRRSIYGRAGEFRFQSWGKVNGVEFRTLSGITSDKEEYITYIFSQLNKMIDFYNEKGMEQSIVDDKDFIVSAINTCNEELAKDICKKYNIEVCKTHKLQEA